MSIVFQKGGMSDLALERGRLLPYSPENININQEKYLTESNNPKITDYGSNLKLISLQFSHLTKDNYDGTVNGLKTWFEDSTINWLESSFTMVDENNVSHTIRLWQDKFEMSMSSNGRYSIFLIFKED